MQFTEPKCFLLHRSMSSCAKQLTILLEGNLKSGPLHIQGKPRGQAPAPLVPMSLSQGENFVSFNKNFIFFFINISNENSAKQMQGYSN